ncbi:MAG TPA: hypothetical protein VFQ38_15450 [Longimicrobiales bacterium]|nr:hypothetical protein [Longimicrobiales bacterium]
MLVLLSALPARAAAPPDSARTAAAPASSGGGFLFGAPHGFLALRVGASFPRAASDVFDHSRQYLTLERGDFAGVTFGGDVGVRLLSRLDGVLSLGVSHASHPSEDQNFVEDNNLPIRQQTSFTQVPITAGLRLSLLPEGRAVGSLAWIPSRVVPFVGAGGGLTYYRFVQSGDFVDYTDQTIFTDELRSSGWGPTAHVFGGFDISLSPRFALTAQARYTWASAGMDQTTFDGFNDIDLSGLQTTVGLNVRF